MHLLRIVVLTFAMAGLAACGSRTITTGPGVFTPALNGTVSTSGGNYYVSDGGYLTILPPAHGTVPVAGINLSYWTSATSGGVYEHAGYMYSDGNVRAIAGRTSSGRSFAGITGTPAWGMPTSGSATYTGAFSGTYYRPDLPGGRQNARGFFTTNVNFSSRTIQGSGAGNLGSNSSLTINGTITGTKFNGTAQFSALNSGGLVTVPMTGGFYGYNTMAGIYQGSTVAGVFYGQ